MVYQLRKRAEEITLALCVSIGFSACANRTINTVSDTSVNTPAMQKEAQAATESGAHVISRLEFDKGRTALTPEAQRELDEMVEQAREMGKVERITVAVWSDMEYPTDKRKLTQSQLNIAEKRGDEVEDYLEKHFDIGNVRVHNMAKQPGAIAQIFNTPDAKLKQRLVSAGITPEDGSGAGRASTALVMVEVE